MAVLCSEERASMNKGWIQPVSLVGVDFSNI